MEQADLLIVGGGAAGLAAAVMAGQRFPGRRIVLLEKQPRVGKKLLATGNGTCNLSHSPAATEAYYSDAPDTVRQVLEAFPPAQTQAFFRSLGVETVVRSDGRVYPLCTSAAAVLDCLRLAAARVAQIQNDCTVLSLQPTARFVRVMTSAGEYQVAYVLVAVGGAAAPSLGGSADGYALLTALGHTRTPLFPSVVQLRTDPAFVRAVKGLRVDACVSLYLDGRLCRSQTGEVLFTDYGLSGPAVMQISRVAGEWERRRRGRLTAVLNLLPELSPEELSSRLLRRQSDLPDCPLEDFLTGLFQRRLGQTIMRVAGLTPFSRPASSLTAEELAALAQTIRAWTIEVTGTQGFGGAQVTAGGVALAPFEPATLRSTLCSRVAAAGEVLNVDGECGGYNLQWAWASASAAVNGWGGGRL